MTTPAPVLPAIPDDALRELLNAYFVARDDLYEAEAAAGPDDPSRAISQQARADHDAVGVIAVYFDDA